MIINLTHIDIKNKISDSLLAKKPISMIRMGDGEMIIAKNVVDKLSNFTINQIGRELTKKELRTTQLNLINSVINSDILGLPTEKHVKKNILWGRLIDYYSEIKLSNSNTWKNKDFCSIDSHLDLLNNNHLHEIFKIPKKIVIVSPRDIINPLKSQFPNINEIEYYYVPGEQKFEIIKNKDINIFERIDEIDYELTKKDRSGELLIYGVGPFGKHLGTNFSSCGGVSLDLGSVFDLFVGKKTRGFGKGPNSLIKPLL